ncbi:MAG: HlyD family secretion protein [Pirellula sp.]
MNRILKNVVSIATVLVAVFMFAVAISFIRKNTPQESATEIRNFPPTAPGTVLAVKRTRDKASIGGVGIAEPVGEATGIGSQLPGVVEEVLVSPGMTVQKGTVLLRLDRRSAAADVGVAEADLAGQRAKLEELQAQVQMLQARLEAAMATYQQSVSSEQFSKRDYDRAQSVRQSSAYSEEEVDDRRMKWEIAQAKSKESEALVREAQAKLDMIAGRPAASIDVQRAAVVQAEANLQRAKTNLDLRTIIAPSQGTVLSVKIRAGEFIPASILPNPLITLGVIDPLHLRVDIDESEIPRFSPTAKAFASVRGRPEVQVPIEYVRTEPLVIPKRSLTGSVSERVDTRVMQVIYSVDPKVLGAAVGQQVDVYIVDENGAP